MLTFKIILMWFVTLVLILLGTFFLSALLARAMFKKGSQFSECGIGIAWIISSLLLSVTCVMLAL